MKKHILLGTALASLFALGACDYNEDNFPGFDEKETITDVSTTTAIAIQKPIFRPSHSVVPKKVIQSSFQFIIAPP